MLNCQARSSECNGENMMNLILLLKDYLYTKDVNPPPRLRSGRNYRIDNTKKAFCKQIW